ncbi:MULTISPECIES: hypothetical protein [unclassified Streptomyces]|uniref:hypothetical protein n=1 Tax=unclassified Streptomyces TaxID=2593676 RepID=UPI0035E240E2
MMIDEALSRELLAAEGDAASVLLEGGAQLAGPATRDSDAFRGAAALLTRAESVDRLGISTPDPSEVTRLATMLNDVVGKLGA